MSEKRKSAHWMRPAGDEGPDPPLELPVAGPGAGDDGVEAFRASLLADLRPVGALQMVISERIILGLWRSLRGSESSSRPRRMVVRWVDGEGGLCVERWEFDMVGAPADAALSIADVARADASVGRQLRKDLESLGAMQGRVVGSLRIPEQAAPPAEGPCRRPRESKRRR
jgi:hypothetical protein